MPRTLSSKTQRDEAATEEFRAKDAKAAKAKNKISPSLPSRPSREREIFAGRDDVWR